VLLYVARLVAHVRNAVAVEVRVIVVGLVVQLVIAADHEQVERRHGAVQEQRAVRQ
jgi:hypothetical protein